MANSASVISLTSSSSGSVSTLDFASRRVSAPEGGGGEEEEEEREGGAWEEEEEEEEGPISLV